MHVPVLLVIILQLCIAKSFTVPFTTSRGHSTPCNINRNTLYSSKADDEQEAISVTINTTITETKVKKLFAWIKTAFEYDGSSKYLDDTAYYYNNIELAIAAAFGDNLPKNSLPTTLMDAALEKEGLLELINDDGDCSIISSKEWEEALIGDAIGKRDRESASLGASKFMTMTKLRSLNHVLTIHIPLIISGCRPMDRSMDDTSTCLTRRA